jgi:outer membrane lipoprotein-sorting protein
VITDATGGVSRMSFTGMVLGGDVPDAQFTFKAPPGITVVQL